MFQEDANRNKSSVVYSNDMLQITALKYALKKSRAEHQLCTVALEELKFLNSHEVRQSICEILSLSGLLEKTTRSRKVEALVSFIRIAALSLDAFSRKMTTVFERQDRDKS